MKKIFFLIQLCIVAWAAATAAQQEPCEKAGALACDLDGSHVTMCSRSGTWQEVRDCASAAEVCADGRCVAANATRAAACSAPGQLQCSNDCEFVSLCSPSGVWVVVKKCPDGTVCMDGECVTNSNYLCGSTRPVVCADNTVGETFPNLEDCTTYFSCEDEWSNPIVKYCRSGYYDPCSGTCSLASPFPCRKYERCTSENEGLDVAIFGNPALHYTCAGGKLVLKKCEVGFYDSSYGECWGDGVVCRKC